MTKEVVPTWELKKMWYDLYEINPSYALEVLDDAVQNGEEWAIEVANEIKEANNER